jgi:sugar phosphate isomerase/epimerase
MLSISTAWNYKPDAEGRQLLLEIKETGLDTIELNYRLTKQQVERMIPLLGPMGLKVSSIHNFCPLPDDAPSPRHPSNYYRLSALDEEERQRAVLWTKKTIDTAVRVKARVVVIHAGMIEQPEDLAHKFIEQYKKGKKDTPEFQELRDKLIKSRRDHRGPHLQSVMTSLKDILPYAQEKNILIGLETRYYPIEIPNFEEIGEILGQFHRQGLHYWHDVGHAEVNSRLGITPHSQFLNQYQDKLIGFHLHGVNVLRDHIAPFDGDFDLKSVFPYIKPQHIKVIESGAQATLEQVRAAVKILSAIP